MPPKTSSSAKAVAPPKRKEKKIIDIYFEEHDKEIAKFHKIGRTKVAIIYQVGTFFEFYGLEYPDGTKRGCMWQLADELGLKIAEKPGEKFDDNPDIKVYMAGIPLVSQDKYYQMAERINWTLVHFDQVKNGDKFDRVLGEVTSPGINIHSDSPSNITMSVVLESVLSYDRTQQRNTTTTQNTKIFAGLAFLDSITGENGIVNLKPQSSGDISILLDEILKTIIVKNPKHVNIYLQGNIALDDETVINAFHLYRTSYFISRESLDPKYERLSYQETVLDGFYSKERGLLPILQQLDLEDATLIHGRISLVLLLEFIALHDKTIISMLSKPRICADSSDYLVMGNNPLEQLDVVNNLKWEYANSQALGYGRRISLLELLDKTKTTMGRNAFRNRLSNPITSVETLNLRYDQIEEIWSYHTSWMNDHPTDSLGSPIYEIRRVLSDIKNIQNIVRKIITGKFFMPELEVFYKSLVGGIKLLEVVNKITAENSETSKIIKLVPDISNVVEIIRRLKSSVNFKAFEILWGDIENNVFLHGINRELDNLQEKIDNDRHFIDNLIHRLSFIIEVAINPGNPLLKERTDDGKIAIKFEKGQYITQTENVQHGIHLVINKKNKDALEKALAATHGKPFKIGQYELTNKDFTFKDNGKTFIIQCDTLKISAVQLKINIENMRMLVKKHLTGWCQELISSDGHQLAIDALCTFIQEIDVIQSIALASIENGYVRPRIQVQEHSYVNAIGIRHPIIEQIRKDIQYVANDVSLGGDKTGILLFGVNAVGKSSYMKAIGINIIMAQAGLFVAASEFIFQPYNYLFTRIKNNDDLYAGLSSFAVEMKEFKVILQYADQNSIILGDELCSGTETMDATALVSSGIIQLCRRKSSFLFATHLHFLAESPYLAPLIETQLRICHLRVETDPRDSSKLVYSRRLMEGSGPRSYGILVCESMNLEPEFIRLAKEIRESMNSDGASITPPSASRYNAEKMVINCEICGSVGQDVHHINQQCTANNDGIISGSFHKHSKWNLVSLCKECHINIHSKTPKFQIIGYVQTTNGILLDWRKLDVKIGATSTVASEDTASAASSDDELEVVASDTIPAVKPPSPPPSYQVATTRPIPAIDVNKIIRDMTKSGKTAKQIQYHLRKNNGLQLTLAEIRDVV